MTLDKDKPYVLRVAELIYSSVVNIKKENPGMTNIQAFELFMTTKDYDLISSGEYHNQWFLDLKNNKNVRENALALLNRIVDYSPIDQNKSNSEEIIKNFYKWGFGKYINEIFISNREGFLPSSADLSAREKVSLCYGYGLQVTLIQLVGAYTALFSNGQFQGLNLISGSYNMNENEII